MENLRNEKLNAYEEREKDAIDMLRKWQEENLNEFVSEMKILMSSKKKNRRDTSVSLSASISGPSKRSKGETGAKNELKSTTKSPSPQHNMTGSFSSYGSNAPDGVGQIDETEMMLDIATILDYSDLKLPELKHSIKNDMMDPCLFAGNDVNYEDNISRV